VATIEDKGTDTLLSEDWENVVMKGSDLAIIDTDINAYIAAHSVPGLSLAITVDDRLVFARGYYRVWSWVTHW
jgi:hypothetical protein